MMIGILNIQDNIYKYPLEDIYTFFVGIHFSSLKKGFLHIKNLEIFLYYWILVSFSKFIYLNLNIILF